MKSWQFVGHGEPLKYADVPDPVPGVVDKNARRPRCSAAQAGNSGRRRSWALGIVSWSTNCPTVNRISVWTSVNPSDCACRVSRPPGRTRRPGPDRRRCTSSPGRSAPDADGVHAPAWPACGRRWRSTNWSSVKTAQHSRRAYRPPRPSKVTACLRRGSATPPRSPRRAPNRAARRHAQPVGKAPARTSRPATG